MLAACRQCTPALRLHDYSLLYSKYSTPATSTQPTNSRVRRQEQMPGSVASLDSSLSSNDTWDEEDRLLQQEWEESLEDLQRLLTFVLMPFLGKWLGRRWSHWGELVMLLELLSVCLTSHKIAFARYTRLGLGKSFFLGERTFTFAGTRH